MQMRMVGVIGASMADEELSAIAEEVGRELAVSGAAVVCGGLTGIIESVCRGASAEGGVTIGIIPSDSRQDANPFVQIPIVTGIGMARNSVIAKTAEVFIAIGGQFGTLSEIAYALSMGKTVVSIRSWNLEKASATPLHGLIHEDNPKRAVEIALESIGCRADPEHDAQSD
ncbi:MAG: TIGR00725 family protein [Methanobacteriota archaeon]|nr:MAG: TIGR00725 family protein [Euryarchaeota archaeon]